jgi:hypothetical protein
MGSSLNNTPCIVFVSSFRLPTSISFHNILEWNSPCYTWIYLELKRPVSSFSPCHIIIHSLVFLVGLVSLSLLHHEFVHTFPRLIFVLFLTRSSPPLLLHHLDMILIHVVLIFFATACTPFMKIFCSIMIRPFTMPHQCACVCRGETYYQEWASLGNSFIHRFLGENTTYFC